LSRRGLNPIKPVYDPYRPDGRLNLTASAFNQLGQYTSSPDRRGYCNEELAVFFPDDVSRMREQNRGLGGVSMYEAVGFPTGIILLK